MNTVSAADAATVNPDGMSTLLPGGVSTVLVNIMPILNNTSLIKEV